MSAPRALVIAWRLLRLARVLVREHRRAPETAAAAVRDTLAALGATFVKLGQGLSQRLDLLPPPYTQALAALQDNVPPFAAATARATVEAAFGRPLATLFATFDDTPLAAASLAQVHRATLADGTAVVVKVRRPQLRAEVEHDLRWLRRIVCVATLLWPPFARWRPLDLVDEIAAKLLREIDFRVEAANTRRMRRVLEGVAGVHSPAIVDPLVHEEVLVQTLSLGRPITCAYGTEDGRRLAGLLLDAFVQQLFGTGFFHGDPHPGNAFVMDDGSLCLHDFGVIGYLDRRSRHALAQALHGVATCDAPAVLSAAVELGLLDVAPDRRDVVAAVDMILAELATEPLSEWSAAQVLLRIARLDSRQHLLLPRNLLLLLRTLVLLEGVTRALDPGFALPAELQARSAKVVELLRPVTVPGPEAARQFARQLPTLLARWLRELEEGRTADRQYAADAAAGRGEADGASRMAAALVALGLYVAGAALLFVPALPRPGGWPVPALVLLTSALLASLHALRRAPLATGR